LHRPAVELGRYDGFFEGADVGGRRDHRVQLVRVELAACQRHMAPQLQRGVVLVRVGHFVQPLDDALGLALPHRLDACVPALTHAVDALDQLGQCEDVGRLQVAGKR
jgi:hypothetical protein